MSKCSNCKYGPYDSLSDFCDNCMCDADTGWGGFTDHRAGKHFDSKEEQDDWYNLHDDDEYDDEDEIGW